MKKKLAVLLLAALICLLLAGCSFHSKLLDPVMYKIVTALNEDDEDAFTALLLMEDADDEELHTLYTDLQSEWYRTDPDEARLVSFSINTSPGEKQGEGTYLLETAHGTRTMSFAYYEGDYGKGVTRIGYSEAVAEEDADGEALLLSVPEILCYLVSLGFVIFTIVDIVRKKPAKYGVYIVVALLSIPFEIGSFMLTVPLGAIIWWCARSAVLKKKAAAQPMQSQPQQHTYTDTSRDPWEL